MTPECRSRCSRVRRTSRAATSAGFRDDRRKGVVSINTWDVLKAGVRSLHRAVSLAVERAPAWRLFLPAALLAVGLRLLVSFTGSTYDFESYKVVASIVTAGGNVYAETPRYNYGPVWFYTLGGLRCLLGEHFRTGLVLLLGLIDVGIAGALWRQRFKLGALLFLFSPLTVFVSGYSNQFDNFPILIVLWAALLFRDQDPPKGLTWRLLGFSILLGLSLMVKHVFALFIFWAALRQHSLRRALTVMAIPSVMFLAGFLPYVELAKVPALVRSGTAMLEEYRAAPTPQGREAAEERFVTELRKAPALYGVITRVFLYRSAHNEIFCRYFLPSAFSTVLKPLLLFVLALLAAGYLLRTVRLFDSVLAYTAVLVTFSPALANQYLAIPVAFTAANPSVYGVAYNLLGLVYLPLCEVGWVTHGDAYLFFFVLLLALSIGHTYRMRVARFVRRCADSIHRAT